VDGAWVSMRKSVDASLGSFRSRVHCMPARLRAFLSSSDFPKNIIGLASSFVSDDLPSAHLLDGIFLFFPFKLHTLRTPVKKQ